LRAVLPEFMLPTTFVVLGELPRTASGKTDRQALPAPGHPYRDATRPATAPRSATEATIAAIWAEVTGVESIDVHDHFYDRGGESLQPRGTMARIRKVLAADVALQSLLDAPTVAELAQTVDARRAAGIARAGDAGGAEPRRSHLVSIQPGAGHRPVFFVPGGI